MTRLVSSTALALLLAAPLAAQVPAGLQMRVDRSTSASDPDDVPEVAIRTVGSGFQVNTGPAAVVWNPANTASGTYTLRGTFTLPSPSDHTNYYGLIFRWPAASGGVAELPVLPGRAERDIHHQTTRGRPDHP